MAVFGLVQCPDMSKRLNLAIAIQGYMSRLKTPATDLCMLGVL